jgi:hypothetical protein
MTHPDDNVREAIEQLAILEPTSADVPLPASQALGNIKKRHRRRPYAPFSAGSLNNTPAIGRRTVLAGAVSLLLLIMAFSFPAVRALASDFLGLFRVQKFAAISVSPEQLALLEGAAQAGMSPGQLEIIREPGEIIRVASLSEAADIAGFSIRTLRELGAPVEIITSGEAAGRLTLDLEGSRAILEAAGVEPSLLPDGLDGKQIDVSLFASVQQLWSDGTRLLQTESPLVEYPRELDPVLLGQALLTILGMGEEEAFRLAQSIDWASTLLLPVPQEFATFSEVNVEGVSGLALSSLDNAHGVIIWQRNGVVFLLSGAGNTAELVSLANSLQ